MKMPAGKRKWFIEVQRNVPTRGAAGGMVDHWTTLTNQWAEKIERDGQNDGGREQMSADQVKATKGVYFKLFQAPIVAALAAAGASGGLLPTHRLKCGSRIFNIASVQDSDEPGKGYLVSCVEVSA